jgi:pyruvate kinase
VPSIQKQIIKSCRQAGKPVVVATQMLDSMVNYPTPTRAEVSDVATAIYDGADAVALSAESASGAYPVEAVTMMDRIIQRTEQDPVYLKMISNIRPEPINTTIDAIAASARQMADVIAIPMIIAFTEASETILRIARERPRSALLSLTSDLNAARALGLVWGTHAVVTSIPDDLLQLTATACKIVHQQNIAHPSSQILIVTDNDKEDYTCCLVNIANLL